jgi:hypothetical protein
MTRDDDAMGEEVNASVSLVVRGVTEENAASGAGGELMMSSDRGIGIACTTKDTKVGIGGGCAIQDELGVGWLTALEGR